MVSVKVVIPVYRKLNEMESIALSNNIRVLSGYPVVFVKPEGLDISQVTDAYPEAMVAEVTTDWIGTKRGIAGYNEMMMSEDFYSMFSDAEYILVCHTDAWIFRDELLGWCGTGYDVVAAPWPTRPRYKRFPFKQIIRLKTNILPPPRAFVRMAGFTLWNVWKSRQRRSVVA